MNAPKPVRRRVLVVDDNGVILKYISDLLYGFGYAPITATRGDEARAIMAKISDADAPDLAIVDIVLGADSGVKLAEDLVARLPGLRVLLISGYADALIDVDLPESRTRTFFLRKAFTPGELKGALELMTAA